MGKKEDDNAVFNRITRLSFVLAILVIFIHANNLSYYGLSDSTSDYAWLVERFIGTALGGLAVPTFFMISGYLFFRGTDVHDSKVFFCIFVKQTRRIGSIVIPYLLWNIFGTLFYMTIPRIPLVGSMMNSVVVDFSFSNLLKGIFLHEYYFPLWYLASLIILIALTPLMAFILRLRSISIMMLVLLAFGAIFNLSLGEINCHSTFYFFIGCVLAVNCKNLAECSYTRVASVISGAFLLVFAMLRAYGNIKWLVIILTLISPILLWVMFSNFEWKVTWFQRQSFFIYVSHVIIVTSVNKIILRFSGQGYDEVWIIGSYLLAPVITLGIIYIIARGLHLKKQLYGLICGGRV